MLFSYATARSYSTSKKVTRGVADFEELIQGDIFYITCIDMPEKLCPFFEKYQTDFHCVYQTDIYSREQWLEIMPKNASKAVAAEQLKKILGCDYLIVFGDGLNDMDLFQMADEAYAVANAVPELKKIAAYWANTSSNGLIGKLLREGSAKTKLSFDKLMHRESIRVPVDEQKKAERNDGNRTVLSL